MKNGLIKKLQSRALASIHNGMWRAIFLAMVATFRQQQNLVE